MVSGFQVPGCSSTFNSGLPRGSEGCLDVSQAERSAHANCVGDVLYVTPVSAPLPLARAELNLEATCDCRRDWKYSLAVGKGQEPDFGEQRAV